MAGLEHFDPQQVQAGDEVTMTDTAINHVRKQINLRGKGIGIRFGTRKSGCSGYAYVVDIIDDVADNDHCFQVSNDLIIVVAQKDFPMLKGTQLDFIKEGINQRFYYRNPNEENSCGCGESFSIKDENADG